MMYSMDIMLHDDGSIDVVIEDDFRAPSETGVYDSNFFVNGKWPEGMEPVPKTALERLADARIGLDLFLNEASSALMTAGELTVDQRIHVATIVSYVDGLANRFDRIRVPDFKQKMSKK